LPVTQTLNPGSGRSETKYLHRHYQQSAQSYV